MSSIKQGPVNPSAEEDNRLGILHASFKWNEVEDDSLLKGKISDSLPKSSNTSIAESEGDTGPSDSVSVNGQSTGEDRKFEMRDINVVFPEGKLTLVTGPSELSL